MTLMISFSFSIVIDCNSQREHSLKLKYHHPLEILPDRMIPCAEPNIVGTAEQ